jgi:hypothetical protein
VCGRSPCPPDQRPAASGRMGESRIGRETRNSRDEPSSHGLGQVATFRRPGHYVPALPSLSLVPSRAGGHDRRPGRSAGSFGAVNAWPCLSGEPGELGEPLCSVRGFPVPCRWGPAGTRGTAAGTGLARRFSSASTLIPGPPWGRWRRGFGSGLAPSFSWTFARRPGRQSTRLRPEPPRRAGSRRRGRLHAVRPT